MNHRREVVLLGVAVLAVSTAAVFIRGAAEAPPLAIAAWRLLLGAGFVALPGVRPGVRSGLHGLDSLTLAVTVLSGLLLAGHFATWIASLRHTSVASSLALVTAHPLAVAIGARWILHERVSARTMIGIVVGLVGIGLLAGLDHRHGAPGSLRGDALALTGGILEAGYILCGRWVRGRIRFWSYIMITYGVAAVAMLAVVLIARVPMMGYAPITMLCVLLLAIVPQGVGHTLINRALRHLGAPTVSLAILAEVPGAAILAWVFLGEGVPLGRALAIGVILLGVVMGINMPGKGSQKPVP